MEDPELEDPAQLLLDISPMENAATRKKMTCYLHNMDNTILDDISMKDT